MNYKQLLILRLSNLTEWLNETEMIIPEEICEDFGWFDTCEFLGDGKYILRSYHTYSYIVWETKWESERCYSLAYIGE